MSKARPDYGIDAPVIVRRLAVVGATSASWTSAAAMGCFPSFILTAAKPVR